MTKYTIYVPAALRIYQNGIANLFGGESFFAYLKFEIEHHILLGRIPEELFRKTIHNGLLVILGEIFFESLFAIKDDLITCDAETAYQKLGELHFTLLHSGCTKSDSLARLLLIIDDIGGVIQETSEKYVDAVFRRKSLHLQAQDIVEEVQKYHEKEIQRLKSTYSANFAERAFHDRQLCEYISYWVASLYDYAGYPQVADGTIKISTVKRRNWPSWLLRTLLARERGVCANCGTPFQELKTQLHIDHILPLNEGGCNDLVNLQLLCEPCNLRKSDNKEMTRSSIPEYLKWHRNMRLSTSA